MKYTKQRMTALLPSTPCTQQMRDDLVAMAEREGKSLSQLQRQAVALFLSKNDMKNVTNDADSGTSHLQEQAS